MPSAKPKLDERVSSSSEAVHRGDVDAIYHEISKQTTQAIAQGCKCNYVYVGRRQAEALETDAAIYNGRLIHWGLRVRVMPRMSGVMAI